MSKRVFNHPPESATGKRYWRSLGQLSDSPEFQGWMEREFPQGAAEFQGGEVSRRNFLQLMGASAALAGLSLGACRRPEKHLVPFAKGVEWSIPGKALFYATSMPQRNGAAPLVILTVDGRPVKVEGNPSHPAVEGRSDTWSQSSILDLYDPDRSRFFLEGGKEASEEKFSKGLDLLLEKAGDGAGLAFVLDRTLSPTRERLREEILKKFPKALWSVYEPAQPEQARAAAGAAFGEGLLPDAQIEKADVILSLDSDFLNSSCSSVRTIRKFASRRKADTPNAKMNRLYVVEHRYTATGGMADHRLRVPASQIGAFAAALAQQIGAASGDANLNALVEAAGGATTKFTDRWIEEAAADLVAAKGRSLVLVGAHQPAEVQVLGHAINAALGNIGATVSGLRTEEKPGVPLATVATAIRNKQVQALFIIGANPVYTAPADLDWKNLQKTVPTVIRLGLYEDESSEGAAWHVPMAHYLESWGDSLASDGSYTAVQPMVLPLYGGWSEIDFLARVAGLPKPTGPELVQETYMKRIGGEGATLTATWNKFLLQGFAAETASKPEALTFNAGAAKDLIGKAAKQTPAAEGTFEVVLVPDSKVDDGRFTNNGWLQELPDPITKLTWDNAAWISIASAKRLGLKDGDIVEVKAGDRAISIPVVIVPGTADNSLTIPLGYGRTKVGRVGQGTGVNAYPLLTTANPYFTTGATVRKTGATTKLAITQEHGALEGRGADLTRQANIGDWQKHANNPEYFKKMGMDSHIPENISLYHNPPLNEPHQWGMTVDLNSCLGCSACMIACQAENNVPIVGKEQVINGREMHWLRSDRYFASDMDNAEDPEMIIQPMLCQHCENAPCETVCPVNATVHSEDGLNVMAYNRCIGTRYCANNCPYKVRRFNFFDYNQRSLDELYKWNLISDKGTPDTLKMRNNPNVTVRMRGVMEKCTFCVQRIQEAKIAAKVKAKDSNNVLIPTDAFTTACAQACPTDAIIFGNINDPESQVSKSRTSVRAYRLLEYLNTAPRISYLARIRNPNMKMPGADRIGAFMSDGHDHGPGHSHSPKDPAHAAPTGGQH